MKESNLTPLQEIIVEMVYGSRFAIVRGLCAKYARGVIDADDILQELVLDMLQKDNVETLNGLKEKGIAYLYNALQNRAIDLIRKSKTRSKISIAHGNDFLFNDSADRNALFEERIESIKPLLPNLKKKPRQVIELILAGNKNTEVAELMGENTQTIGAIKGRGIKKLKSYLVNPE